MDIKKIAYFFITMIGIVTTLIYGHDLLIPVIFAMLMWFIIREIRNLLNKIPSFKRFLPNWVKTLLSTSIILALFFGIGHILTGSIESLAKSYPQYEKNVDSTIQNLNNLFGIDIKEFLAVQTEDFDFGELLSSIFDSLSEIVGNAFMILLYALFIFLEESFFHDKMRNMFRRKEQYVKVARITLEIEQSVKKYLGLKTLVSIITGFASYIALLVIGVDSPAFWAFLIFLLNFIPTIGSLIGTVFPAIFALLQFGELTPCLIVLGAVGGIQILVGNILEPKLMGNSMNISPLVAILALSFWGSIWGITGMLLSVPITVVLIIIFSKFSSTQGVAILLSEKGVID